MSQRKPTTSPSASKDDSLVAQVQSSAKRQAGEVFVVAEDAVTSGAWVYPIRGIIYTISHPTLLQPLLPILLRSLLIALGVIAAMFFFTYLPQVAVLAFVSGPLAFIGAVPLVLGEAYIIILFLTRTLLVGQAGTELFDAVLLTKNHTELVKKGRLISPSTKGGSGVTKLGRAIIKPVTGKWFMSTDGIARYILTLPLNLIPVVGTVFFLGYNGMQAGPSYHQRYFQLKGYDKTKKAEAIKKRRGAYTAFGTVAMALNLIPVASIIFTLTTSVGAALWASDIENKSGGRGTVGQSGENPVVLEGEGSGRRDAGKKEL